MGSESSPLAGQEKGPQAWWFSPHLGKEALSCHSVPRVHAGPLLPLVTKGARDSGLGSLFQVGKKMPAGEERKQEGHES